MVGATVHMLSKGLDSGDMLFHALPDFENDPFDLGMRAVKSAHKGLVENLKTGKLSDFSRVIQDKSKELRYTKNIDFDDQVASDYLNNLATKDDLRNSISNRTYENFLHPFVY